MLLLRFVSLAMVVQCLALQLHARQPNRPATGKNTGAFYRLFADSSFMVLKASLGKAMERNDQLAAAQCLEQMGKICFHLTHFPQALDYHLQADKIFREQKQSLLLADNLNNIGTLFVQSRQPELARQQYDEAFSLYNTARNDRGRALTHRKIGHLFETLHHYDSGFYYQRLALNEYTLLKDQPGIARVYEDIGNMFEDLEKYDSARTYFQRALLLTEHGTDTVTRIEALNNMGDVFRKTGNYIAALPLTRAALTLALKTNELFHLGSAYRDMAKTHHFLGNDDSAYYFQRIGQGFAQDIYSRENGTQLAILKTMYDVEKKNSEIGRLKVARRTAVAGVIIGILLLAVGALVISRQRLRIRNAQLLNEQEKNSYQTQKTLMEMQEQNLKQELELRSKELSTYTLHLMQKNKFLEKLHLQLDEMLKDDRRDQRKQLKQLQLQINQNFNHEQHWEEFNNIFDQVHQSFFQKLKERCNTLTRSDLRLVALLKMNIPAADIATLLGISQDTVRVTRYRLRKKLNLEHSESLTMFIQSL